MKKLGYFILLIVLIGLFFGINRLFKGCNKFVEKFENLDKEYLLKGTLLNKSDIIVTNIRTSLKDTIKFKGIKLINFWATWCKPCIAEIPNLEKLNNQKKGFEILLFSYEKQGKQINFLNNRKSNLNYFKIEDTFVLKQPLIFPTTIIVKDGIIVKEYKGQTNFMDTLIINEINSFLK